MEDLELTILMPCLNEENTIQYCIKQAKDYLDKNNILGEVLIVDNGSIDNSVNLALELGARVVLYPNKGYGNALIKGIKESKSKFIIFGDCDCSYDFSKLDDFIFHLRNGKDFVIGNRLSLLEKGSMPFLHRYIGVPILSWLGRKIYKTNIKDFHCGLRGVRKDSFKNIPFKSKGMEFASEIIGKAVNNNLNIKEVNINYYKDKRNKKSNLRPFRDGLRHIKVILLNRENFICSKD